MQNLNQLLLEQPDVTDRPMAPPLPAPTKDQVPATSSCKQGLA